MPQIQENIPLRPKTTLKIGGSARYYAELSSKEDVEETYAFAKEKNLPLIVLGAGSNTIFADGIIEALVVKIVADDVECHGECHPERSQNGAERSFGGDEGRTMTRVYAEAGKYLAPLINELAEQNLDLSALTGIPGTVGGAIFGNAGQGFGGTWTDTFIESVEVFEWKENRGKWKVYSKDECEFGYRASMFKKLSSTCAEHSRSIHSPLSSPLIWSCTMNIPSKPKEEVQVEVDRLLKRRIETQPHRKTAGSCFLSLSKEAPAWKLIEGAGLRGHQIGGIKVSEKHSNFLMNEGDASFEDAKNLVEHIKSKVSQDMKVEMRFVEEDGSLAF